MNTTLSKKRRIQPVSEQTMLKLKTGYVQVCTAARLYLFKYCQSVSHSICLSVSQFVCLSVYLLVCVLFPNPSFCPHILCIKVPLEDPAKDLGHRCVIKCCDADGVEMPRKRGVTGFRPPPGVP